MARKKKELEKVVSVSSAVGQGEKLTMDDLRKMKATVAPKKKVVLAGGKYVMVDTVFSYEKMEWLFMQYALFVSEYAKYREPLKDVEMYGYLQVFIVICFSDILEKPPESFEEWVQVMDILKSLDVCCEIYLALPDTQIALLWKMMGRKMDMVEAQMRLLEQEDAVK